MRKSGKTTGLVAVLLCGVTGSLMRHPVAAKAATPVGAVNCPVITSIVARNYRVIVWAGDSEAVYTVIGDNGQPLVDHITLAAMKQSNPELFSRIAPALAMGSVDAAIDTDGF